MGRGTAQTPRDRVDDQPSLSSWPWGTRAGYPGPPQPSRRRCLRGSPWGPGPGRSVERRPCFCQLQVQAGAPCRVGDRSKVLSLGPGYRLPGVSPFRPAPPPPAHRGCCLRSRRTHWRPLCPLGRSSRPRRCHQCLGSCGPGSHSAKQSSRQALRGRGWEGARPPRIPVVVSRGQPLTADPRGLRSRQKE